MIIEDETFKSAMQPNALKWVRDKTKTETEEFPYISKEISYDEFFSRFLVPNKPCIFSADVITKTWHARQDWVAEDGSPDIDSILKLFGHVSSLVPIADCKRIEYGTHPKDSMYFTEFLDYWQTYRRRKHPPEMNCFYLKDWHFTRVFPDYKAYETPVYFQSDWMNEYWDQRTDLCDDYRFVYMGPKGSWTPFHADVFRSYSWSANICGRKKWTFYTPGEEEHLKDKYGHLPFSVSILESAEQGMYPNLDKVKHKFEVIQEPGEVIFVPSGWHHQVENLEDTISINHNWLNACNVDICWSHIKDTLQNVKREISDCEEGMEENEWQEQCQLILKASSGIDYADFFHFMSTIAKPRIEHLQSLHGGNDESKKLKNIYLFDLSRVNHVVDDMLSDEDFKVVLKGDEENVRMLNINVREILEEFGI